MERDEVIALMETSSTEADWTSNCATVKRRCGGYPPWWFEAIVISGLRDRVASRWGGDSKIHARLG